MASFFYIDSLSSRKWTFPEGLRDLCHTCGNSGGGEGGVSTLQKWKIKRWVGGGGVLSEIPSLVGVGIFSGTTHCRVMLAFLPRFTFHISDDNLKVIPTKCTHPERCPHTSPVTTKFHPFQGGVPFNSTHPVKIFKGALNANLTPMATSYPCLTSWLSISGND